MGVFASIGTVLTAAGIYGVIAYLGARRTREFGILALGADAGRLIRLVLGHGGRLVALGLIIGGAGALGLTRLLASAYGVTPTDARTFVSTATLLAFVALAACMVPAPVRREWIPLPRSDRLSSASWGSSVRPR
jgi:hypothetical protein